MSDENQNIEDKLQKIKKEIEDKISAIEEKKAETKPSNKKKSNTNKKNIKKTDVKKSTPLKEKNRISKKEASTDNKKKLLPIIISSIFIVLAIIGFVYIKNLKNELNTKKEEIQKIKDEAIDYSKDSYYKEVEEEPEDDELQDFSVYKDVSDPINEKSKKSDNKIKKDSVTEKKNSLKIELNTIQKTSYDSINSNNTINSKNNNNFIEQTDNSSNTSKKTSNNNKPFELYKKEEAKEEVRITSDIVQIIPLEHTKGNKYILPKKKKKINSFKVRVKLNKTKKIVLDKTQEIMLVIKDALGRTLKIDVNKVNFKNNDLLYTTFYSKITDKILENQEYSFHIFANKRLLKIVKKSI